MSDRSPRLPSHGEWLQLGVQEVSELHAGKQSRVFAATIDGRKCAVKLTDSSLSNRIVLDARMQAVVSLAGHLALVIEPARFGGDLVREIGPWLITVTPFVDGERVDIERPADGHLMGTTLAQLHRALARLPSGALPPVAALDTPQHRDRWRNSWQLLHGDFSDQNTVRTPVGLRIFDFDDCGYGPIEYDIANSLYMVLFDSVVNECMRRYEAFRPAFLAGYASEADLTVDDTDVDAIMGIRISALASWIDDLPNAPIGIRTATPAWLETLRTFVTSPESIRGE